MYAIDIVTKYMRENSGSQIKKDTFFCKIINK